MTTAEPPGGGWLIEEGGLTLWIIGREPKGKGFALDPNSKGDAKWWVEVTGRPEVVGDLVVLRAQGVILVSTPGSQSKD